MVLIVCQCIGVLSWKVCFMCFLEPGIDKWFQYLLYLIPIYSYLKLSKNNQFVSIVHCQFIFVLN